MDYEKIGFKCGIECHQQWKTSHKLFCACPCERTNELPYSIHRKLRAVAGETGAVDVAAKEQEKRKMNFVYKYNTDTTCLVELDEEPPHPLNTEALTLTLTIAKLLDADIIDEIQVMRKNVVDGSNVSGFQRTALVAMGGELKTSKGIVGITTIAVEEEAATIVERKPHEVVFRLDRLGIPLIEMATDPGIKDPKHLKETALLIGQIFRSTGKAMRGIGSIRQDINISIAGGARIEIKGAQELNLFEEYAKREVQRQQSLLEVKKDLEKRKAKVDSELVDVTKIFKETKCKFVHNAETVFAIKLNNFSGVLGKEVQPGRRVGSELSDYAKTAGVGGIIHSDEDMSKYKITELPTVRKQLNASEKDAIILVADKQDKSINALHNVLRRAKMLFVGVPEETRKPLPDGNSSYMRPLPGAARLYVETDIPPVLSKQFKIIVPELPEVKKKRLLKQGLSEDLADKLLSSGNVFVFEKISSKNPGLVASTLEDTLIELRREGLDVDISVEKLQELFSLYDKNAFSKESIPEILRLMIFNPSESVENLSLQFQMLSEEEVRKVIQKIISSSSIDKSDPKAFSKVMGDVMKELRGKADGKLISATVKELLK